MHIEHQTRYNLSFTAVSLRPELARIVAEHYMQTGNWDMTKVRILSSNALQCRSVNSAVRMERELRKRLKCLTDRQIAILTQATVDDRAAIAWLAALKDNIGRARIALRIRSAEHGNFGDCEPVGEGVSEMRIHFGPGYRVYFTRRGEVLYLLLLGGDKSSQKRNIKRAIEMARALDKE